MEATNREIFELLAKHFSDIGTAQGKDAVGSDRP